MTTFTGAAVFDGTALQEGALSVVDGHVSDAAQGPVERLDGGWLLPGLLDLQVNGGGGHQVSGATTAADLAMMCRVHARLGATGILPTLITDTPEATAAVITAGTRAAQESAPGFLGLHLEGPHLSIARKGAHDPALIRPMEADDLARTVAASEGLEALLMTLAPENATNGQIAALHAAGAAART